MNLKNIKPAKSIPTHLETKIKNFFRKLDQMTIDDSTKWLNQLDALCQEVSTHAPHPLQLVMPGLHDYHKTDLYINQIHLFYYEYYLHKASLYLVQNDILQAQSALTTLSGFLPIPGRKQVHIVSYYNRFLDLTCYTLDLAGHNPYPALHEKWHQIMANTTNHDVKVHYLTVLSDWIPLHQPLLLPVLQTLHRLEKSRHNEASMRYFAQVAELSKQWRQALYYQAMALRISRAQDSIDLLARRAVVYYHQGKLSLAKATMNHVFHVIETYHWSTIPEKKLRETLKEAKGFFQAIQDFDALNQVEALEMQIE